MNINSDAILMAKKLLRIDNHFEDDLLVTIGTIVEKEALAKTLNEAILVQYELLSQMIAVKYRLLGTEGLTSTTLATVSESYVSSYPDSILIALRGFRKLQAL